MARGADHDLADSLPDIEGALDRAARWVGENPAAFLIGVGAVLLVTGGISLTRWWAERSEIASAEAVAAVRSGYLKAMADAARTYALANEPVRATALADRVAAEAPDLELPDALAARMSELRAAHAPAPNIVPAPGLDVPVEKADEPAPKAEAPAPKP